MSGFNYNQITIVGHLGGDPDIREQNGSIFGHFSVATTFKWENAATGSKGERTDWHNIHISNGLAKVARNSLKKGSFVFVVGELQYSQEKDEKGNVIVDKNGKPSRRFANIRATRIGLLDPNPNKGMVIHTEEPSAADLEQMAQEQNSSNSDPF